MKLHRYVDHQRLHIVTKDVISLSISVLLLFRHYISHKITFGAPSSGGVLCSACGAFISKNNCLKYFFTSLRFSKLLFYKYLIILVNNLNSNLSYGRNTQIDVNLSALCKYFSQKLTNDLLFCYPFIYKTIAFSKI